MTAPLIPQEVYLLERYSSLDYFRPVRDNYEAAVKHAERCLEAFVNNLPPDYRDRPLNRQPDIVWGERVLPNMRSTLHGLFRSYIRISHGELKGLRSAMEVGSDRRGIVDHWDGWMDEPQVTAVVPGGGDAFWTFFRKADRPAGNIMHSTIQNWEPGDLSHEYLPECRGPLNPPERWPRYRLNSAVQVKPGQTVSSSGIYLPDVDSHCAQLLLEGDETEGGLWKLIERVPGETIPFEEGLGSIEATPQRVPAGEDCSRAGYWHTPAKQDSRRYFKQGDTFPEIEGTSYGATFWQWSPDQSDPRL